MPSPPPIVASSSWSRGPPRPSRAARNSSARSSRSRPCLRATVDGLTGIANRNHFIDTGDLEMHRARRYARPLSVVLIDLDHFKQINDTHGHAVGDAVIKSVVRACLGSLRTIDRMGRLGGEEFAALLPETNREGAAIVAERLRAAIAGAAIEIECRAPLTTTASIGVANLADTDATRIEGLIAR